MANVKITELVALSAVDLADNDVFPIVDVGNDTTKKVAVSDLRTSIAAANDFVTFTQLNSNINVVSANAAAGEARRAANVVLSDAADTALQARLTTNVSAFTSEDTALQARLTTNVTAFTNEDTALQARIAANTLVAASNDFITFTRLNANIDLVQDNVASVTVGTAADTETRLNANLNVLDANADAIEARRVANVTVFTDADTALQSRLTTNVAITTAVEARRVANVTLMNNEDTALQARLTTNVTALTNADTALQARITANSTAFQAEDTALQARITANSTLATAIEARRAANLVSATFTGQVNMSDDLVVSGNLTVNGATTTVSTTNLDVEDRVIMLADGVSGSPSADVGILFNRGNQGNAAIFYDESAKTFKFSDTKDPKSNTSLSPVTASNISVGILDAATIKYDGADLNTAISTNVSTLSTEATAIQARLTTNVGITTAVEARRVANVTVMTNEDTALQARIAANSVITTAIEARRVANIAGAISSVLTGDLTASRTLVSDGSGKIAISDITSTELAFLDGLDQNLNSNLAALAAGISAQSTGDFPAGDYGLLDAANAATDSFGIATAGLTTFDLKTDPVGSLATEDLGAF